MGYTISYGAKDLTPEEIRKGIEYVRQNRNHSLFEIGYLGEDGIRLDPAPESPGEWPPVESFSFPPGKLGSLPYQLIKTNMFEPHDSHVKLLMGGLEKLLQGKFAATDHQSWSVGSLELQKRIGMKY